MTQLSIIIPAIGPQSELDDLLVSVLESLPPATEVLLIQPPSYVDPYNLGDEVRLVETEQTDLLGLFNAGISACRGSVTHLLTPGLLVEAGWCDAALELFEADLNIGSVAPRIAARRTRRTVHGVAYHHRCGKTIVRRRRRPILAPLLGAGFFQTAALRFMHGYQIRFGEYADVELGLRMKSAGYKAVKCNSHIYAATKIDFQPTRGFRGGRIRSELANTARHFGWTTSTQALWSWFGEPITNGLRPISTLTAMSGHLVDRFCRPTPAIRAASTEGDADQSVARPAKRDRSRRRPAA